MSKILRRKVPPALAIGIPVCLVLAFILLVRWQAARYSPRRSACLSNLKQLMTLMSLYAEDSNDHMPPAAWMAPLQSAINTTPSNGQSSSFTPVQVAKLWTDPELETQQAAGKVFGYAMNYRVVGLKLSSADSQCVTLFETDALGPDITANLAARSNRHRNGSNVAFVDGHARWFRAGSPLREEP